MSINIHDVSKKGNPTLACHCALITGCMNVIFLHILVIKIRVSAVEWDGFLCHFGKNGTNRRTIKIVSRNQIFSLLVKIFIEPTMVSYGFSDMHGLFLCDTKVNTHACMDALSRNIIYLSSSLSLLIILMTFPKANRLLFIKPPSFIPFVPITDGLSEPAKINQVLIKKYTNYQKYYLVALRGIEKVWTTASNL